MAGIDKIYGTHEELKELRDWLSVHNPELLISVTELDSYPRRFSVIPLSNFSTKADCWLYKNCPLKFVVERIKEQYEGDPND